MTKGKVVLVAFPFDDFSATKVRPAVCLTNPVGPNRHVIAAFVTSRIPSDLLPSDLLFESGKQDFRETGLRVSSTLRLHRLITISTRFILRRLGEISPSLQAQVDQKLRDQFGL